MRDEACFLEEATHTYFVYTNRYAHSVSSVWKVFFPEFNAQQKSQEIIQKAKTKGIRNFASSIYNLYIFLLMERRMPLTSPDLFPAVEASLRAGVTFYEEKEWSWSYDSVEYGISLMKELITGGCHKPTTGKTCYFLPMTAGCSALDLCRAWEMNGSLESFKGTLLHQRAELYMQ